MKTLFTFILTFCLCSLINAQNVKGKLTLNGKSQTKLELTSNSAVALFKEFKQGKYKLQFFFEAKDIPKNMYKETIIFFDFITVIKKNGKLVKNIQRKQPIPYFAGEMFIPAEAFDFIGALATLNEEEQATLIKKGYQGTMPKGKYSVQLNIKPVGFKGETASLEFGFSLGDR